MATNRIIGLDLGTYSVKLVHVDVQREMRIVGFDEELLEVETTVAGPPPGEDFDSAKTNVGPRPVSQRTGTEGALPGEEGLDDEAFPEEGGGENDWVEADPLALAPAWARAIRALVDRGAFDSPHVVTFLPGGKAMTIHVEVPFDNKGKVSSILNHLLMDRLPVDLRQVVHDFVVVPGKKPEEHEAIVGFTRREQLQSFLETSRLAGVDPLTIGIPELMLQYVGERAAGIGVGAYAIVDIGHKNTQFVVIDDGRPVVARTIQHGGHHLTEAISKRFRLSMEDSERLKHSRGGIIPASESQDPAMAALSDTIATGVRPILRELRRTLQSVYAQYRVSTENIYICGGSSRLKNLAPFLEGELGVSVERLDLTNSFDLGALPDAGRIASILPMGLSLAMQQVADKGNKRLVNLRQGEFSFRGKSSYLRSEFIRLGAAAAVLTILLATVLYMQRVDQRAQYEAMRAAVTAQTTELFGEPVQNLNEINTRLRSEEEPDRGFVPRMSAYELMYNIISNLDRDIEINLERLEVDTDRNLAQIVGTTTSAQNVDRLATELRQNLSCLREVKQDRVTVRNDNEVQFELHISSGCS